MDGHPESRNPNGSHLEPFLSRLEVARWLGISVDTVKGLPIPVTRVGRQWRYRRSDVELYLEQNAALTGILKEASGNRR